MEFGRLMQYAYTATPVWSWKRERRPAAQWLTRDTYPWIGLLARLGKAPIQIHPSSNEQALRIHPGQFYSIIISGSDGSMSTELN